MKTITQGKMEMSAIQVTLMVITVIEILSVVELYFMQERPIFNGVGIYSGWEISKEVPEVHELIRYLVHWVAGIKLIVVALLLVLVLTAPQQTLVFAAFALVMAIGSFFWRMYPSMRKLDRAGCIRPMGRSRMLCMMVLGLEAVLAVSLMVNCIAG